VWREHRRTDVVSGIAGIVVGADDPTAMAARWGEVLDAPQRDDRVDVDGATVSFVATGSRGEGIDGVLFHAGAGAGRRAECDVCGVRVAFR
jgi:hypothetical protein